MAATLYLWHTWRFDVFHVNPPLTRIVSGISVMTVRPKCNWHDYSSQPQSRSEWSLGEAFIEANTPQKIRLSFALARWALIPLLLLGGYFGYRLSREIYGDPASFVYLILWCFSPLLLGLGATMCPDAVAASLSVVATFCFYRWLHEPGWLRAIVAGICLGLLPLSKLTWMVAFGVWPTIWCVVASSCRFRSTEYARLPPFRQLVVVVIAGLYVLNIGYLADGTCRPLGEYVFSSEILSGADLEHAEPWALPSGNRFRGTWIGRIPVPFPSEFVQGLDTQRHDFERTMPSYVRGEWVDGGCCWFYLYALLLKVPLGTWCAVTMAAGMTVLERSQKICTVMSQSSKPVRPGLQGQFERDRGSRWRDEMVVVMPALAILALVSSQTGFTIHSRYVVPALPLFLVWTSKVGRVLGDFRCTRIRLAVIRVVVVAALTWMVSSSLWAYPHSVGYFNELTAILPTRSGEWQRMPIAYTDMSRMAPSRVFNAAPNHLLDSNIDWGQDLFYLKEWLDGHPEVKLNGMALWSFFPATYAGIPETMRPPVLQPENKGESIESAANVDAHPIGPLPGWHAVSVNHIYSRSREFHYFQRLQPFASAGYSIYIYHITLEDANRVRRELGLPELPKHWKPDNDPDASKMEGAHD